MNAVIGIISYFPDDLREERRNRFRKLLVQLNTYFKLPIIVIAQNWNEEDFKIFEGLNNQKIQVYTYQKLGITIARGVLRKIFLSLSYDWLIMFDDDMEIIEDQDLVNKWLGEIQDKEFYWTQTFLTNFCAISKEGFSKVDYDYDVDSSKGNGFEDWIFVQRCIAKIPSKPFETYLPARTRRGFLSDSMSTWDPLDPELKKRNEDASRRRIYDIWAGKD